MVASNDYIFNVICNVVALTAEVTFAMAVVPLTIQTPPVNTLRVSGRPTRRALSCAAPGSSDARGPMACAHAAVRSGFRLPAGPGSAAEGMQPRPELS